MSDTTQTMTEPAGAPEPGVRDATRRRLLLGVAAGAVAVPVLAACGSSGDSSDPAATPSTSPSDATQSPSDSGSSSGAPAADALAKTSDIEVGGAVFLDSPNVVITQPTAGDFHAFDRTCTHAQCPVTDMQDGKIHCRCHDSLYDPTTGANVGGPAPSPLTAVSIKVDGDSIVEG